MVFPLLRTQLLASTAFYQEGEGEIFPKDIDLSMNLKWGLASFFFGKEQIINILGFAGYVVSNHSYSTWPVVERKKPSTTWKGKSMGIFQQNFIYKTSNVDLAHGL